MRKIIRFWQVLVLDALGIIFMLASLATGWLPGPGGIPLFIIGLSLLAINHDWAKRYMTWVRQYADRAGDYIFADDRRLQLVYDIGGPILLAIGGVLLARHSAIWTTSLGLSAVGIGVMLLLGNRGRWPRIKQAVKRKR